MGLIWGTQVCELVQLPYKHVAMEQVFSHDVFARIKEAALTEKNWIKDVGALHSFWSLSNVGKSLQENPWFAAQLEEVQDLLKRALQLDLSGATISIFKLCPGDAIGLHDDSDIKAVRLVVKLSTPKGNDLEGELILFGESVSDSIVYDMPENCGVGFATSSAHIHSISQSVTSEVIYLIAEYPINPSL